MIKKKICLLGSFAVGKTSLINRFVHHSFSDKYHTTIGVKIDKKNIEIKGKQINLIIWDIHGEDRFQHVQSSYLIGSSGYFLVIDATRNESLSVLNTLKNIINEVAGNIPFKILINKSDLLDEIEITPNDIIELGFSDADLIWTSAKTGEGVENAFLELSDLMLVNKLG